MKKGEKRKVPCDELYKETQQYGELAGWQPVPSVFLSDCLFFRLFSSFSSAALTELQPMITLSINESIDFSLWVNKSHN